MAVSSTPPDEAARLLRRIRLMLAVFIGGLVLSGVTAFPLVVEIKWVASLFGLSEDANPADYTGLTQWIATVQQGILDTDRRYPFLAYGTDWLAFGHIIIALFFVGLWRDPVRNVFNVKVGIAACILVVPLALICGPIRHIPFFHQLIDCAFGVGGIIPLLLLLRDIRRLEALSAT
jgi:hypothetical protein